MGSARVNIEGHNLDCLNIANLRRRLNRSLVLQGAYQLAEIDGEELTVSWQYDGYCRVERETGIEFSIDSDNAIPFGELECFAYDLQQDPKRLHKIQPMLVGGDGLSKKIIVPFLKPILHQQPFKILLFCRLPGCIGTGFQYYTSTLSFAQRSRVRLAVHLVFAQRPPEWLRVYECDKEGRAHLVSQLRAFKNDGATSEYLDHCEQVSGQNVRIYVFRIDPLENRYSLSQSERLLTE